MKSPRHIAIILDGNRRFAKRLMLEPWKGHELGFEKLKKIFQWCKEFDIREMTLFCFSMQNFNRPKLEFDFLMNIFSKAFEDALTNDDIHNERIRINVIGRWYLFPEKVRKGIIRLMDATKDYDNYKVNLAMAYGGREELIDAIKKIAEKVKTGLTKEEIDEQFISSNLYLDSEPDLIIRTGGERRTSNFLIWQSNYSEWLFLEKTWPEFEKQDLQEAIAEYKTRERRFGK
ncbi:di-trans,poly-cis-decaprenylcistransferase [Candidatus Pacearchaeota archaeon]|nr:di-trans,poly-cis-decaprenylcistransferase [Candidatus Pacearchaeota archaeon]